MTKAEALYMRMGKNCHLLDIIAADCPSDYGMKNVRGCQFQKNGLVSEMQCLRCWTQKFEEEQNHDD